MQAKKIEVKHQIQKYILSQLYEKQFARFSELRPSKTDTNLFSYHLKQLQKNDFVVKADDGYMLSSNGLLWADRTLQENSDSPEILIMTILQDGYGGTLLAKNKTQPFIDMWTLPTIRVTSSEPLYAQVQKTLPKKYQDVTLAHKGDCYVRVKLGIYMLTKFIHVFYGTTDEITPDDTELVASPHSLPKLDLAPGIQEILARAFFRDPYFFEEFTVD